MWGENVRTDLQVDSLSSHIPFRLSWGAEAFQEGLHSESPHETNQGAASPSFVSDLATLKQRQLPLLGLRANNVDRKAILEDLQGLSESTAVLDDCLELKDERITESIEQILWPSDSMVALLNTKSVVLNAILFLKTILAPGLSILTPLLAFVLPFVLAYMTPGANRNSMVILDQIRGVLRSQVMIPSTISRYASESRFGSILEMFFIGFALVVFIAGLWSQITAALHLRAIWFDVVERGNAILRAVQTGTRIVERLRAFPSRQKQAVRFVLEEGEAVLETCACFQGLDGGAAYGSVWNDPEPLFQLREWLSRVDVYATLSDIPGVCFPKSSKTTTLTIRGVHHPAVPNCVRNDYDSTGHMLLTGPNRGGKSTFCKAIGLAILTAQTWGFAYAESMTWSPFAVILTALEPCGKLGYCSTFEAEIEFAKSVLQTKGAPSFVMMDEIFHSTNAHDGIAASRVFLSQLYEKPDTISIVSTHYAELTTMFDSKVQAQQLVATKKEDGSLAYTYKVGPGASSLSSVMEILEERGLRASSAVPSVVSSVVPSTVPSAVPSVVPSVVVPSVVSSVVPSTVPSAVPVVPSAVPSAVSSAVPVVPSAVPLAVPLAVPSTAEIPRPET